MDNNIRDWSNSNDGKIGTTYSCCPSICARFSVSDRRIQSNYVPNPRSFVWFISSQFDYTYNVNNKEEFFFLQANAELKLVLWRIEHVLDSFIFNSCTSTLSISLCVPVRMQLLLLIILLNVVFEDGLV